MIDELPENQLVSRVKDLSNFMNEFKNKQIVGGASLVFSLFEPIGDYQWSGKIDDPGQGPGTYVKTISYEYTAPNQDNVYADLIAELYIGNLSYKWNKVTDYYLPLYSAGTYYDMVIFIDPQTINNAKTAKWKIVLTSNDNLTTCYLKFKVVSSDK